ncbi:RICIN domain-containing protein [Actinoplanes bogorensis]|uniref:RICIN domain-containing protein n=1 Tax=Paractinoplanes bogorensis TaxID=1610840 RepID=A0ABS5YNM8_9ACTN|nr:RICIN domain-containing protein [Actinoplanes bogorensis]MBU2665072.1 RICIN domain-containing protein [Actinoplanes bogorensis]
MRRSSALFTALVAATLPTLLVPMAAQARPSLDDRPAAGQATQPVTATQPKPAIGSRATQPKPAIAGRATQPEPATELRATQPRPQVGDVLTAQEIATMAAHRSSGVSGRAAAPIDLVGLDFQIINAASRWCLTSSMTELPCATTDPYRWRFRPVGATGLMELLNVRTNTCLTMPGGTTTDGARAGLAPCEDLPSRRWTLRDSLGETAKVVNARSGKCLQIQSGVAVQDSCAGTAGTRRWTVRVVGLPLPGLTIRQR